MNSLIEAAKQMVGCLELQIQHGGGMPTHVRDNLRAAVEQYEHAATLDRSAIAATILKQRLSYSPHWDKNLFRAMDDSAKVFADALKLPDEDRAAFLCDCGVQS